MELIDYAYITKEKHRSKSFPASCSPSSVIQSFMSLGALDVWNMTQKCREFLPLEYHDAKGAQFRLVIVIESETHGHATSFIREFPFSFSDSSLQMAARQAKNSVLSEFSAVNLPACGVNVYCKGIKITYPLQGVECLYPARNYACLSGMFDDL